MNSLDELIQVNAPEELWKSCLRVIKQSELLRISPNRASLDKLKTLVDAYGARLAVATEWAMTTGERLSIRTINDLLVGLSFIKERLGVSLVQKNKPGDKMMGIPRRHLLKGEMSQEKISPEDIISQLGMTRDD